MKVRSFRSIHRDLEEELTPSSCFPSSPWRSSCSYCTITIGEPSELNSTENLPETPVLLEKKNKGNKDTRQPWLEEDQRFPLRADS